jgi:hypothetical protein
LILATVTDPGDVWPAVGETVDDVTAWIRARTGGSVVVNWRF